MHADEPVAQPRARVAILAALSRAQPSFREVWLPVLVVWAASRAFYLVAGLIGHVSVQHVSSIGVNERSESLGYWANWDGEWFSGVALNGYTSDATTAFFPLYPLLVRFVAELGLNVAIAGVVISTLATLAALYFVFELARVWHGRAAAVAATLTLAFFPTAFYFNAVYSDPLFLALTAGSIWALYVRRDLVLAGAFAFFAALTRNIGGLLLLPLAYEWYRHRREFGLGRAPAVVLPVAGLGTYMVYLWTRSGDPLLFSSAYAEQWHRTLANPLRTIHEAYLHSTDAGMYLSPGRVLGSAAGAPAVLLSNTLNFWFLMFAFAALVLAVRRIPFGALLYAVPAALGALALGSTNSLPPLVSYPRYVLVVFPLFVALGAVLARRRLALAAWVAVSAGFGAYLTVLFTTGRWVA